jgi:hypothetical protein
MKYLYREFYDEISSPENLRLEDGMVYLRSRSWSPIDLIELSRNSDGTNPVEEEIFKDWFSERLESKIDYANQFLEQLESDRRFLKLTQEFKRKYVMPFVGAGLSMPSGYPGWTSFLLRQQRQTLIQAKPFSDEIATGKYEECAQALADAMRQGFSEAVEHSFGCDLPITGPVQLLPYLFDGSICTTNFDNVLERVFIDEGRPLSKSLIGFDVKGVRDCLRLNTRFLLKIHGNAEMSHGRIFTKEEYDATYAPDGGEIRNVMAALCNQNTLLFIGCSLTFDRTLQAIKAFVHQYGHDNVPRHYAFLEHPTFKDGSLNMAARVARQDELAECNIFPIWYPEGSHDEAIEALLLKLYAA